MLIAMGENFRTRFKKARTEKDLRLLTQKFFKESLKGLPPGFRIKAQVLSINPPRVMVKIPAHSEGNPIRITQVDQLIEELEDFGLEVILCYQDDLEELNVRKF
ncbi:hypothetical protein Thein_0945 [Thermodesulfatator indicus DSM 15286]|uniref:DUF721 domain-containing protein n=2 Tax=Thermodesulfatator indicus TaxID=171695 RepID=F8AD85_THEID|nr:hypothetical protein Thein_0945 [Thermodesulfatator indicus DSM 15286]